MLNNWEHHFGVYVIEISFIILHFYKSNSINSNLQDEKHPAENLLNGNVTDGKWLISSSSSVTSMAATFQLAECCVISSVHIGNNIFEFKWLHYRLMILVNKVNP
jgi:hypothetical protein